MKIRTDFVTNSSSSSFIISKNNLNKLTSDQIKILKKPYKKAQELGLCNYEYPDSWALVEHNGNFVGWTITDNFDWIEFMKKIDIDVSLIEHEPENMGAGSWGLNLLIDYENTNKCNITGMNKHGKLDGTPWLDKLTPEEVEELNLSQLGGDDEDWDAIFDEFMGEFDE